MNSMLCLYPNQFNNHNIIIQRKMKNNIIDDSFFYRLIYSDEYFSSNGLYILFNFTNVKIENYYNKIKCTFDNNKNNNNNINNIKNIEQTILSNFINEENKILSNKLEEQLKNYNFKLFEYKNTNKKYHTNINIVLKISGIWSTMNEIGITFKFYIHNSV